VHASQEQRSPESAPLVRWARPDHPDLADGVFAATIGHLSEFTEAKRYKRSGGIDRDQVQVGFVGGGPVGVRLRFTLYLLFITAHERGPGSQQDGRPRSEIYGNGIVIRYYYNRNEVFCQVIQKVFLDDSLLHAFTQLSGWHHTQTWDCQVPQARLFREFSRIFWRGRERNIICLAGLHLPH
jgi:hypothetical protein